MGDDSIRRDAFGVARYAMMMAARDNGRQPTPAQERADERIINAMNEARPTPKPE